MAEIKRMTEFMISYSDPYGDFKEQFCVWSLKPCLGCEDVHKIMEIRDAQHAGLPLEESAGFEYIAGFDGDASCILCTTGLGPCRKDNVMLTVAWRETGKFLDVVV